MNAYITKTGIVKNKENQTVAVLVDGVLEYDGGSEICESEEKAFDILDSKGLI